jgi:hypothetical protein
MKMRHTVNFSNSGTRNEVRMRVVDVFSGEAAGEGKGDLASRHVYEVETLADGDKVLLNRPANLHYGFDFLITVENKNFNSGGRLRRNPSFDDLLNDLRLKKEQNLEAYQRLLVLLGRVYSCMDVLDDEISNLGDYPGYSADLIVKVYKWFFIEQDIRYWNYGGRTVLWAAIQDI